MKKVAIIGGGDKGMMLAQTIDEKTKDLVIFPVIETNNKSDLANVVKELIEQKTIDVEEPKSGRENRRERRKQERKNKKL